MTAKQILTEAIRTYNIDTFDEEQKHLHVTLTHTDDVLQHIILHIPSNRCNTLTQEFLFDSDSDEAYQKLLIQFIYHSLQNLKK